MAYIAALLAILFLISSSFCPCSFRRIWCQWQGSACVLTTDGADDDEEISGGANEDLDVAGGVDYD